jgi:glutamyl-tRNA synthetase
MAIRYSAVKSREARESREPREQQAARRENPGGHNRPMSHDGRFAPSPTGQLHLGSLRTALAAWLIARASGGRFLVRIEDLDPQRSLPEFEREQLDDLAALGIDWDGPAVRQSERQPLYRQAIETLSADGRLYPCFCTRAEIRAAASAPHGSAPSGGSGELLADAYPGTCRSIPAVERAARLLAGERHALRFSSAGERVSFTDGLLGPQSFVVDDFVVQRTDGVIAYQLAVTVDDANQRIGEVVRGADLLDSTARQLLLARALSLPAPRYAHIPLVLGPDGARLAKRHGARRPDSPVQTLRLLAGSLGIEAVADASTASELLPSFDAAAIPRGPVSL